MVFVIHKHMPLVGESKTTGLPLPDMTHTWTQPLYVRPHGGRVLEVDGALLRWEVWVLPQTAFFQTLSLQDTER